MAIAWGVPTVGGEVNFHRSYNGNILVNAMCVGLARKDKFFLSAAKGAGNPVVYIGSKTGATASMAPPWRPAEFDDASEEKRPTVQVGDPFTEKLLLEACLELMATDAIVAIQDMGAAGLPSSSAEMADKGGSGIELDLDQVPQREANMTAYDMMLSESQERMLAVLKPGREAQAEAIFRKWELDFAVIGITTDTKRLVVRHKGDIVADMPVTALSDEAPKYQRPFTRRAPAHGTPTYDARAACAGLAEEDFGRARHVLAALGVGAVRQHRHGRHRPAPGRRRRGGALCMARTRGSRSPPTSRRAIAPPIRSRAPSRPSPKPGATSPRWARSRWAVTDNLNFGNPQKPQIMGEIVSGIDGIGEACRALDFPVIGGNCSLYNETNGEGIAPTPAIGGVGLMQDVSRMATVALKREGDALLLIARTKGHLGQSIYLREIEGKEEGAAPPVDLAVEKKERRFRPGAYRVRTHRYSA